VKAFKSQGKLETEIACCELALSLPKGCKLTADKTG